MSLVPSCEGSETHDYANCIYRSLVFLLSLYAQSSILQNSCYLQDSNFARPHQLIGEMCWKSVDRYDCGHTQRRGTKFCAAHPNCPMAKDGRTRPKEIFYVNRVGGCPDCQKEFTNRQTCRNTIGGAMPALSTPGLSTSSTETHKVPLRTSQLDPQAQSWESIQQSQESIQSTVSLGPPPPAWIEYMQSLPNPPQSVGPPPSARNQSELNLSKQPQTIAPLPPAWNTSQQDLFTQPQPVENQYSPMQNQRRRTYTYQGRLEWDETPHPTPTPRKAQPVRVERDSNPEENLMAQVIEKLHRLDTEQQPRILPWETFVRDLPAPLQTIARKITPDITPNGSSGQNSPTVQHSTSEGPPARPVSERSRLSQGKPGEWSSYAKNKEDLFEGSVAAQTTPKADSSQTPVGKSRPAAARYAAPINPLAQNPTQLNLPNPLVQHPMQPSESQLAAKVPVRRSRVP